MRKPKLEAHEIDNTLKQSPDFNIFTEKGKRVTYRGVRITLGQKKFDHVWHYWWFARIEGKPYGFTYLIADKHTEMRELARAGAQKSIDLLLPEIIEKGGKLK